MMWTIYCDYTKKLTNMVSLIRSPISSWNSSQARCHIDKASGYSYAYKLINITSFSHSGCHSMKIKTREFCTSYFIQKADDWLVHPKAQCERKKWYCGKIKAKIISVLMHCQCVSWGSPEFLKADQHYLICAFWMSFYEKSCQKKKTKEFCTTSFRKPNDWLVHPKAPCEQKMLLRQNKHIVFHEVHLNFMVVNHVGSFLVSSSILPLVQVRISLKFCI